MGSSAGGGGGSGSVRRRPPVSRCSLCWSVGGVDDARRVCTGVADPTERASAVDDPLGACELPRAACRRRAEAHGGGGGGHSVLRRAARPVAGHGEAGLVRLALGSERSAVSTSAVPGAGTTAGVSCCMGTVPSSSARGRERDRDPSSSRGRPADAAPSVPRCAAWSLEVAT